MSNDKTHTNRQTDTPNSDKDRDSGSFLDENGNILFERQRSSSAIRHARSLFTNLKLDPESKAPGNKFVESIVGQINRRSDMVSKLPLSPNYYKLIWINIAETIVRSSPFYPAEYDEAKWIRNWETVRKYGACDIEYFNSLAKMGIAHCIGKNILVFNETRDATDNRYLHVISPCYLKGRADATPVVLSFDGYSYRGLSPVSLMDASKINLIVEKLTSGVTDIVDIKQIISDKFEKFHIPSLLDSITKSRHSLSRRSLRSI